MILVSSGDDTQRRHRDAAGRVYETNYMGMGAERYDLTEMPSPDELYPMAYLVERDPNTTNKPHFHVTDQFQLVVGGDAMVGPHKVEGVSIHFSAPYSPYGPIVSGENGVQYLTLRNAFDPGSKPMPASREELRGRKQFFQESVAGPFAPVSEKDLAALNEISCEEVIGRDDRGLGGWLYKLPPNQSTRGPEPSAGGGQFWVVLAGGLDQGDGKAPMPRLSCVFLSPDEAAYSAKAGPKGLEVLLLQFPVKRKF